jgi:hypothetical protein
LKLYARSTRLRGAPLYELYARLIHDERNVSPLCLDCHGPYGTTTANLRREHVPASAFCFAAELGPEWVAKLERAYPEA